MTVKSNIAYIARQCDNDNWTQTNSHPKANRIDEVEFAFSSQLINKTNIMRDKVEETIMRHS